MPLLFATLTTTKAMPPRILPKSNPLFLSNQMSPKLQKCGSAYSTVSKSKAPPRALGLTKSLKLYRMQQSGKNKITPSNVFGDKMIRSIVARRPETLEKLQAIAGMGTTRILKYGLDIIKMICAHKKNLKLAAKRRILTGTKTSTAAKKVPRRPRPRPRPRPIQPRPYGPRCASPTYQETAGNILSAEAQPEQNPQSVYILELDQERVYVGVSRDVEKRIAQHLSGSGSAFTRFYRPTGVRLPRLGNVSGSGDAVERDETLRYMYLKGMSFVRGWKYTQVNLSEKDYEEAESNIRELYDLCRRCGGKGHFMSQCKCTRDRFGDLIK